MKKHSNHGIECTVAYKCHSMKQFKPMTKMQFDHDKSAVGLMTKLHIDL